MRLDLFLKKTCVVRQRSEAKTICDAGAAWVNGRPAKSSHELSVGDQIELRLEHRITTLRVLAIPTSNVARADAARWVEVITETPLDPPRG